MKTSQQIRQKVFVTNFQGQDVGAAKAYGDLRFITQGRVESFKLDVLAQHCSDAMNESSPDDWILTTGHMVLGVMAALEFVRRHKRLNLLIWHVKKRIYVPRILTVNLDADMSTPFFELIMQAENLEV